MRPAPRQPRAVLLLLLTAALLSLGLLLRRGGPALGCPLPPGLLLGDGDAIGPVNLVKTTGAQSPAQLAIRGITEAPAPLQLEGGDQSSPVERQATPSVITKKNTKKRKKRRKKVVWEAPVVVIPAVYREWESEGWPEWIHGRAVYLYQRTNASAPRYAPNFGLEGGVYLKFIVDFYDSLPDVMVFVHADPQEHNPDILQWMDCLHPDVNYTSLNTLFLEKRGVSFWNEEGIVPLNEACWRQLSSAFGLELTPGLSEPVVSCYCCQQFAISRAQVRRHTRKQYRKAYQVMAGSDYCYRGEIDASRVWSMSQDWISKEFIDPDAAVARGASTQGDAMEHLSHFLLGGEPLQMRPYGLEDYCKNFLPADTCPGSPCDPHLVLKKDKKYLP